MIPKRFLVRAQIAVLVLLTLSAFAKNNTQIVVVPVANMYSKPTEKADVVSQAIYGSNVKLLEARGEWSRIQTSDRYRGWTPSRYLRIVLTGEGYATAGPTVQVQSIFANVYTEPRGTTRACLGCGKRITPPGVLAPYERGAGAARAAKSQRERDYIEALAVMYADYDKVDHRTRLQAYAKAMEQLASRYPDDDEAQIHYALALNTSASPNDKTYANQLKGAALLEPIFKRQPDHPGVAHYLIHLYDYPPIAEKGLEAARRYAKIAPAAAHAQHMPSHIFTRLGYWDDSIASNVESARVAKADNEPGDQLHAMDYLVYANLQLGQDRRARAVVDEMASVANVNPNVRAGTFALAAGPARYMVERGDWQGAAAAEHIGEGSDNRTFEPGGDPCEW